MTFMRIRYGAAHHLYSRPYGTAKTKTRVEARSTDVYVQETSVIIMPLRRRQIAEASTWRVR